MRCGECEYSTKVLGQIPVLCTYDNHNYFLHEWTFEKDNKPAWCPYRMRIGETKNEHDDCEQDIYRRPVHGGSAVGKG